MTHRRSFLHSVLATGIAPYFVPASVLRSQTAPSNKTTLGADAACLLSGGAAAERIEFREGLAGLIWPQRSLITNREVAGPGALEPKNPAASEPRSLRYVRHCP